MSFGQFAVVVNAGEFVPRAKNAIESRGYVFRAPDSQIDSRGIFLRRRL